MSIYAKFVEECIVFSIAVESFFSLSNNNDLFQFLNF